MSRLNKFVLLFVCLFTFSGFRLLEEGQQVNPNVKEFDCQGVGITCSGGGIRGIISVSPGGGGEANTASNLGGGLANFDSKSGVDLRFNSFSSADFDLLSNLLSIDDTKWAKDSELHAAVTLAADADILLGLSGQQLNFDVQIQNRIFAGPASGADADPTFRLLVLADIPNLSSLYEVPLTFQQSLTRTSNTINLAGDSASPGNSKYYGTNAGGTKGFHDLPVGGGGEANTASNTGTVGTGIFKQKTGVDLQFYKLNSASTGLTLGLDGVDKIDFTLDAEIQAFAGLVSAADKLPYYTGAGVAALTDLSAFARTLMDDANASTARTTLGLVIGSDVQAFDATLASIAALGTVADKIVYTTGVDTWAEATLTSFARTLLDDTTASAFRTTLGIDSDDAVTFGNVTVDTEVYDATGWNGDNTVPTKDAVRDKIEMLPTADTNANWSKDIPGYAFAPLEAADVVPPLAKDAGTNLDQLTAAFDDSTDDCRTAYVEVPSDIAAGNVTFNFWWYSLTATTGNVEWYIRSHGGTVEGGNVDAALTDRESGADAVQGIVRQSTKTVITVSVATLGWTAGDLVPIIPCRDGNDITNDTMVGDAQLQLVHVEGPRA